MTVGLSKANEALIFGKKMDANELLQCGFVKYGVPHNSCIEADHSRSKIFPKQSDISFHAAVREHLIAQLDGLDPTAVLTVKKLVHYGLNEKNSMDGTNLRESYEQADRFASGIPAERFGKIARKEIKHKL